MGVVGVSLAAASCLLDFIRILAVEKLLRISTLVKASKVHQKTFKPVFSISELIWFGRYSLCFYASVLVEALKC